MKVKLFQPRYPEADDAGAIFEWIISTLDSVTDADLIVLPEGANAPSLSPKDADKFPSNCEERLKASAIAAAKRCGAYVCINGYMKVEGGYRNRSILYSPEGEVVTYYDKCQLPPAEAPHIERSYLAGCGLPPVVEHGGIRFGFITCYDAYYDEYSEALANQHPDVILLCSYQRWETPHVLQMQAAHTAHKADCFVLRSSWKLSSGLGGNTLVASPDGKVEALLDTEGVLSYEFDPHVKRTAPKNQGMNYRIDRTPRYYLPAGAFISDTEKDKRYPRVCAHRGLNAVAPENTLPAFAAAIALGADEIEFDVRSTMDGVPIICHDSSVDRTTDGHGCINEMTLEEIRKCDAGIKFSEAYAGTKIPTLEEVFQKFACQTIFNMHLNYKPTDTDEYYKKIFEIIYRYGAEKHVYIAGDDTIQPYALKYAPELARCCLVNLSDPWALLDNAKKFGCGKIQLFKPYYDQKLIDDAKAAGIRINLFFSDDRGDAKAHLDMGVDTILTNKFMYDIVK